MGIAMPNQVQANAQQAIQTAEAQADIKLKEAQAANIAAQTPQVADLMQAQITSINQGVNNAKAQEILTDAQTQMQRLQNSLQGETLDDNIATIRANSGKTQAEFQQAVRNNWMDAQTANSKIQTINGIMIGTFLQNELTKAETGLTQQQIQASVQQVMQNWKNAGINQQNANTQEGQLKIQQLIKDIPDSKGILLKGLTQLIPSIHIGL